MPTDNIKEIMDGDVFMQDQEGNIKKIAEITQFETRFAEKDDAADAMRYAVDGMQKESNSMTMTISEKSSRRLQKMLGIERITRKRFIKLLMSCGIQRNQAEKIAEIAHKNSMKYTPMLVQEVIEIILRELKKL